MGIHFPTLKALQYRIIIFTLALRIVSSYRDPHTQWPEKIDNFHSIIFLPQQRKEFQNKLIRKWSFKVHFCKLNSIINLIKADFSGERI